MECELKFNKINAGKLEVLKENDTKDSDYVLDWCKTCANSEKKEKGFICKCEYYNRTDEDLNVKISKKDY